MKKAHVDRMVKIIGEWLHNKRGHQQSNDLDAPAPNEDHLIEALRAHQWRRYETTQPELGRLVLRKHSSSDDTPMVARYGFDEEDYFFMEVGTLSRYTAASHNLWMYVPS